MTDIETSYIGEVPLARRKALGQFFTPAPLARLMAAWCLAAGARTLLDPAVGTGLLVREALRLSPDLQVAACDSDPAVLAACAATLPGSVELRCGDFLLDDSTRSFDAIISNPPYLGYKHLPYDNSIFARYDQRCALRLNRQSNLYVLFIIAITCRLAAHGRAAILVPSDWLNGNFGTPLKSYLLREHLLDGLVVFDQNSLLFADSLATSCLLLLRRGRQRSEPVAFVSAWDAPRGEDADLAGFVARAGSVASYEPAALVPQRKWLPLLPSRADTGAPQGDSPAGLVPLASIATVRRGIATGANDYFVLSAAQVRSFDLPLALFKRCLARAAYAPYPDIGEDDVARLQEQGARLFLLDPPPDIQLPALERYLQQGLVRGIDQRYLPAHRRPWYRMEQRSPSPILFTTFARGPGRFVFNRPLLANLTAFHGITLHPQLRTADWLYERALVSYLVTSFAANSLRAQQRLYGAGLRKVEPADLAQVLVPDLRRLPHASLADVSLLFDRHCAALRSGADAAGSLRELEHAWTTCLAALSRG